MLGFSTQSFYKWRKTPSTQCDWDDAHLINAAPAIHADDPAFGCRFIAGERPGHGIVARGEQGRPVVFTRTHLVDLRQEERTDQEVRSAGSRRPRRPPVPRRPSWRGLADTDITEHRTDEGKLYLCAIKDVYSNRIVGYSIDSRLKASLAVAALGHAIATRSPVATSVHSDCGSQTSARENSCISCRTTDLRIVGPGWSVR